MGSFKKKKNYFQNWISVIGHLGAIVAFALLVFLFVFDLFTEETNTYLEVFLYLIIPITFFFFLFLIPLGAFIERWRRKKKGYAHRFPKIDFNNPYHQKMAYISIGVITFFALFMFFGVYRAYEFTESNMFCGQVCHDVMHPEFIAYHNSPHARVECVECHVGHGFGHYMSAKFQGFNRLRAMLTGNFEKPIKTPVLTMRPAKDTCENCHWPEKHFGVIGKEFSYFFSDEENSEWKNQMLIYVGGTKEKFGDQKGVHWHMNLSNRVSYIATDEKRLVIPWVKLIKPDGKGEIFVDEDSDFLAENPPDGEPKVMDCIDCHNRASHKYLSPEKAVNDALSLGKIVKTLPFIKREAVSQLTKEYSSQEEAGQKIKKNLQAFYQKEYPGLFNERASEIKKSINTIVAIYKSNFFPKMNVSWSQYPDHIGHFVFPGCFRCHDGKHKSSEGHVISNDCNICHLIIQQGTPPDIKKSTPGFDFKHPVEIGEAWGEMPCSNCHSGG